MGAQGIHRVFQGIAFVMAILFAKQKLETDVDILPQKSITALQRYGHQVVIGNVLQTRKHVVTFFSLSSLSIRSDSRMSNQSDVSSVDGLQSTLSSTAVDSEKIELTQEERDTHAEIEARIVSECIRRHTEWISANKNA
jgi:phosphopantothenate-cysteine ligase